MKMKKMNREQISALADSELAAGHIDMALENLYRPDGRDAWDVYHQVGDVLRSDEMAITLSPGFTARMGLRLEAEPTITAPACHVPAGATVKATFCNRTIKRFALPGMVAAAAATVALVSAPQLMVAQKEKSPLHAEKAVMVASTKGTLSASRVAAPVVVKAAAVPPAPVQEGVVLRDSRIDEYLLAHQRFSPSVYSTAQYARSATFATDSDK